MFGFGLIVPTLPLFAKRFGVREAGVGLLLTVFSGTRLAGDVFAGKLIDRWGDRLIGGLGAAIVGASSVAAGAAPNFPALVVLRGIGGVGSAFFLGALLAHLIGIAGPGERGRVMGMFQGVVGIGFILGPIFGGVLAAVWGLSAPLYAYGAICLASAPLTARVLGGPRHAAAGLAEAPTLPEEVPSPAPPAPARLRPLLRDSAYRAALATSAATFFATAAMQTLVPGMWRDALGRSEAQAGIPFTANAVAGLAVLWHAGAVTDRRGRKSALVPALALAAASGAALGYASSAWALVALMAVAGVANGYSRPAPTAMVADVASPESRGVAVGGYRTAGDIGAFIGPIAAGLLAQGFGRRAAFIAVGAVFALTFAMAAAARETAPFRAGAQPAERIRPAI